MNWGQPPEMGFCEVTGHNISLWKVTRYQASRRSSCEVTEWTLCSSLMHFLALQWPNMPRQLTPTCLAVLYPRDHLKHPKQVSKWKTSKNDNYIRIQFTRTNNKDCQKIRPVIHFFTNNFYNLPVQFNFIQFLNYFIKQKRACWQSK